MEGLMVIRDATRKDIPFLVDSNASMALETEDRELDRTLLSAGVDGVFDHPQRGFYLVAEEADRRIGCLLITFEWSDWRNGLWWWLQSVFVVPDARRRGVFQALYADVERRARDAADVIGLRLYVERENTRAQATYLGRGMCETPYRFFEAPFTKPHA
jgi:GNAT superfamily N-acetyltransferase